MSDELEVDLETTATGEAIIELLETTIAGIKPRGKRKFSLKLRLREKHRTLCERCTTDEPQLRKTCSANCVEKEKP